MIRCSLLLLVLLRSLAWAAEADDLLDPANRITPDDPAWRELAAGFARQPDATAPFREQRYFPFRKAPVELQGESRVSAERGLSLHYTAPEERIVILDSQGVLMRDAHGGQVAPADPRAEAANAALVQVLRFDLAALAVNFEIFGRREGTGWILSFVPRAADQRRTIGQIIVAGEAGVLNRIEIRRSARQYVSIQIGPAQFGAFNPDELRRFFR
jgi:hypothetical protein